MKIILPAIFAFFFGVENQSFSQHTKLVTGMVATEDNAPLEGALVRIKGTNRHSGSQSDGIYYIEVSQADTALVFSCNGYDPGEIKLTGDAEYSIRLSKAKQTASAPPYKCSITLRNKKGLAQRPAIKSAQALR